MRPRLVALAALALLTLAPSAFAEPAPPSPAKKETKETPLPSVKPEDYAKALLGAWRHKMSEGGAGGYSITTYFENGTATSSAHLVAGDRGLEITAKAKWSLEGNKLTVEITESSLPEVLPVGTKAEQTIVSVSEKEFRYIQRGKEITDTRVKPVTQKPTPAK